MCVCVCVCMQRVWEESETQTEEEEEKTSQEEVSSVLQLSHYSLCALCVYVCVWKC